MFGNLFRFIYRFHPQAQIAVNIVQIHSPNESAFNQAVKQVKCCPTNNPYQTSWRTKSVLSNEIEDVLANFAVTKLTDVDCIAMSYTYSNEFLMGERNKLLREIVSNGSLQKIIAELIVQQENVNMIPVYLPIQLKASPDLSHMLMEQKCSSIHDLTSVVATSAISLDTVLQATHDNDGNGMETLQVTLVCATLESENGKRSATATAELCGYEDEDEVFDADDGEEISFTNNGISKAKKRQRSAASPLDLLFKNKIKN